MQQQSQQLWGTHKGDSIHGSTSGCNCCQDGWKPVGLQWFECAAGSFKQPQLEECIFSRLHTQHISLSELALVEHRPH